MRTQASGNFTRRLRLAAMSSIAVLPAIATPSQAASSFWQGGIDSDWFKAGNWVWDGVVPGSTDQARIDSPASAVIGAGSIAQAGQLWLGVTSSGAGLTVSGSVTTSAATIGYNAGSTGTLSLSGGTASWTANNNLIIGETGSGIVNVTNGADLFTDGAILGGSAPGNLGDGTVVVDGTGSTWQDTGRVFIGRYGTGTLELANGGTLASAGGLVANEAGSTGTVTIEGSGSSWTANGDGVAGRGTIQIGNLGNGTLIVRDSGTIASVDGYVGSETGSNSTATITGIGSTWTNSRDFFVGHNSGAEGTVTVSQGGKLTADGHMQIGNLFGSTGTLTVTDAGSSVVIGADLNMGWHGNGILKVLNGATVTATGTTGNILIGNEGDATGQAIVDGSGSQLSSAHRIVIGGEGQGTLTLSNGATISATNGIRIAAAAGSTGILNIGAAAAAPAAAAGAILAPVIQFGPDGGGRIVFNAINANYDLSAKVSGVGSVDVHAGNLTLSGNNTYSGGTRVRGGTLTLGTSSAAGTGAISLDGGTTLSYASGINIANNLIINDVVDLQVNSGTATQSGNLTIAANGLYRLRGNGVLQFTGTTTNASGLTRVSDGATILVNGILSGALSVDNAGRLKGNGTVGTTTVTSGGTVAPGNSIGTLNIVGDVTFNPGSVYEVEADAAGSSDRISATGTAFLNGGTVSVIPESGLYAPNTVYAILSAGTVTGTFADVTSNLAFLVPSLSYDGTTVYLALKRNGSSFASVAQTPNQLATAGGIDSMSNLFLANAVTGLTAADARSAFDAMSGELHATITGMHLEQSSLPRTAMLDRLRQAQATPGSALSLAYAPGETIPSAPRDDGLWGSFYGALLDQTGNGNAVESVSSTGGFAAGFDDILHDWRLGAMVHGGSGAIHVQGRSSEANITDYGAGIYAGTSWQEVQLSLGAAYTRHDINSRRSVSLPGVAETLVGNYAASTGQIFGEATYEFDFGAISLTPFANLAYVLEATDAFAETGGNSALGSATRTDDALFATVGVRGDYSLALDNGALVTLSGSLAWRHAFADNTRGSHNFASGGAFSVTGTPVDGDALQIGAALDLDLNEYVGVGVSYNGQLSSSSISHGARVGLVGKF
jgi:outer membrane autotransporter protein